MIKPTIFFVFISTFLFESISALRIEICPLSRLLHSKVSLVNSQIFSFDNIQSEKTCEQNLLNAPSANPFRSALVITDSRNQRLAADRALSFLTDHCKLKTFKIDLSSDGSLSNSDLGDVCDNARSILIFDFVGLVSEDRFKACTIKTKSDNDSLSKIVSQCRKSVWVSNYVNITDIQSYTGVENNTAVIVNLTAIDADSRNKTLIVATLQLVPFVHKNETNGTVSYTGLAFELLARLASEFDFKYEIVEPVDQAYGMSMGNGTWNGGVGMLQRGEIDIFAGALTITYNRSRVVDFGVPFHYDTISMLIQRPKAGVNLLQWTKPLSGPVWAAVIASVVLGAPFLYFLHAKAPYKTQTGFEKFSNCIWYLVSGLMNQGSELHPTTSSAMLFLGFWWLYCVAVIAVYSGVLVAMLTTQKPTLAIKSFIDLAEALDSDYKLCIVRSTSVHTSIMEAPAEDVAFSRMRSWLVQHPQFIVNTTDDCIKHVLVDDKLAMVSESTGLESMQKQYCSNASLVVINDHMYPSYLALAFPKGSNFSRKIAKRITRIYETGLLEAWRLNHSSKYMCQVEDATGVQGVRSDTEVLNLNEITGIIIFVVLGVGVGIFAVTTEAVIGGKHPKWRRQVSTGSSSQVQLEAPRGEHRRVSMWATPSEPEWAGRISPIYKRRFGNKAFFMYL